MKSIATKHSIAAMQTWMSTEIAGSTFYILHFDLWPMQTWMSTETAGSTFYIYIWPMQTWMWECDTHDTWTRGFNLPTRPTIATPTVLLKSSNLDNCTNTEWINTCAIRTWVWRCCRTVQPLKAEEPRMVRKPNPTLGAWAQPEDQPTHS